VLEQLQVFPVRVSTHPRVQHVVGDAERRRREQVLAVAVRRERARLTDQPVDHVTVSDPVLAAATQPRHALHHPLRVPHLHVLGVQAHLDPLADRPARHRVRVPTHVDRAPRIDSHLRATRRLEATRRQRPQLFHLLARLLGAIRVQLAEQVAEVLLVRLAAGEVATAAEQQLLVERALEAVVTLFDVAVLVAATGLDRLPFEAIVTQQRLVALRELGTRRARWNRSREPIRAVNGRHATQLRQRVLQAIGQRLERLGEADRARLPVRVGQHEVVDQVIERLTRDGHAQIGHVREVGRAQPTRRVNLREEHLLRWTVRGPPHLDPSLKRAQLAVRETTRMFALQLLEQRQRFQPRIEGQPLDDAGPDVGERVRVSPPGMRHPNLAGKPAEPAVLAGGLGIHARPRRRNTRGRAFGVQLTQAPNLLIRGEHAEPSTRWVRSR
jgi:hypothetical protein